MLPLMDPVHLLLTVPAAAPSAAPRIGAAAPVPSPWVWIPTLIAAGVAAAAGVFNAVLQRRSGREAAAASKASAEASHRSARAAEDSVALNERTSAGMALRAETDARSKRYQDAAAQLGHASPAVRLAGVYAIAHLADEWADQQQSCIDVLCAYLRMPWPDEKADADAYRAEVQVRRAIFRVIDQRLSPDGEGPGWTARDFDLADARLVDVRLERCRFAGQVTFARATFTGSCVLERLIFERGAAFDGARLSGQVKLRRLESRHPHHVTFTAAVVEADATVEVSVEVSSDVGRHPVPDRMRVEGRLHVSLPASEVSQPPLWMDSLVVVGQLPPRRVIVGRVSVRQPVLLTKNPSIAHSTRVRARDWSVAAGARVEIPQVLIDEQVVDFGRGGALRKSDIAASALTFTYPEVPD